MKATNLAYAINNRLGASANYEIQDVLAIKTSKNQVQVGWLATQSDMLSEDWETTRLSVSAVDGIVSLSL